MTAKPDSPFGMVRAAIGREVRVIVKGGVEYRSGMRAFDDFINIVLENARIYEPGREPTSESRVFVRGSNVLHISLPENRRMVLVDPSLLIQMEEGS